MVSWAYVCHWPGGRLTLEQTRDALTQLMLNLVGASEPAKAAVRPRRSSGGRRRTT